MTRTTPRAIGAAVAAFLPLAASAQGVPDAPPPTEARLRSLIEAYAAPDAAAPVAAASAVPSAVVAPDRKSVV